MQKIFGIVGRLPGGIAEAAPKPRRSGQPSPARRSKGVATAELLTLKVTLPAR